MIDLSHLGKIWPLLVLVLLTACQGLPGAGPADAALVLYSGRSESLVGPLLVQFTETTGIEVQVRYGTTAGLAATLLEEGQNSPADLFWAQDPGGLGAIAEAGMLEPIDPASIEAVPAEFRSPDNLWVGVSGRARVVVYNTDQLSPDEIPDDLWGFTEPSWKGKVGWAPTNGSFQVMVTGMRQAWGEADTEAWLAAMIENDTVVYDKNTPIVQAVGDAEILAGLVNHYYLFRFLAEEGDSFPARNVFLPGGGPGSLIMVSGIGQLSTSERSEQVEAFISFLLSEQAQRYFAEETFEYSLLPGISLHPALTPLEELSGIDLSLHDMADLEGTVRLLQKVGALP
jgi:iron(III) transport system substrate-binding protein